MLTAFEEDEHISRIAIFNRNILNTLHEILNKNFNLIKNSKQGSKIRKIVIYSIYSRYHSTCN